jgi:hypothetical protein
MIKLLWNSHNQVIPPSSSNDNEIAKNIIWGNYHKKNSDEWIFEILNKVKFNIIEDIKSVENGDVLIIVDSNIERKNNLYSKLRLICSKMFLIHLGDESGILDMSELYDNFNYSWRVFCNNRYFSSKKVSCLPIGYKSGTHLKKNEGKRKYKWTFIGTPHKSSRQDLLFQLSEIKPSFVYKTEEFNKKIIEVNKMNEILLSTNFIPCPNGFVHPETYRLYEALECGCIPIVENAYNYYDRLLPNNPFLKVNKWIEAKTLVKKLDNRQIEEKRKKCENWWKKYKNELQYFLKGKINS